MSFKVIPNRETATKPPHLKLHEEFMAYTDTEKQSHGCYLGITETSGLYVLF